MKAVIFTLGCKVNEVESEGIAAKLSAAGWETSFDLGYADIYILNTCAVTREAEKKSRQLISRARKFNPNAPVYVCGCASEKSPEDFKKGGVVFSCGARDKDKIISDICSRYSISCPSDIYPAGAHTRAFIKIQDGCNNFCSYCIIPYLRGREKSRSIEDILGEISSCAAPEIVLTGINISSFNDGGQGLEGLIRALYGVKKRIRLGSLECSAITEDFLNALKGLDDFAEHFHLSLQSGSTKVLKSMNRHYTRQQYLQKCQYIYKFFPDAAITTDIIAGFSGESEEDFEESLSIIPLAGFSRVHAFPYSPREGTKAFSLPDIPAAVKKERTKRLIEVGAEAENAYISKFLGRRLDFIAEQYVEGYTSGYTGNYIRVYVKGELEAGKKYGVLLKERRADGALAEVYED